MVTTAEQGSRTMLCAYRLSIFYRQAHGSLLTGSVWRQLLWKLSIHRRHTGSRLEMRNKGKSFPVLARTQQGTRHKRLEFIFILHHPRNWSTKSPSCSPPLLPHFTPTSLLSILFLEVIGKWNELEHLVTHSPPKDTITDHVTSKWDGTFQSLYHRLL